MNRVWTVSDQKGSARLLLLAIADNCNKDGEGWPGISYLAEKTKMSVRQTQRLIQYLAGTDELAVEWDAGRGKSNYYHILTGLPAAEISQIKADVAVHNAAYEAAKAGKKGDILSPFEEIKGDILTPFMDQKGDILTPEKSVKGDTQGIKGDIFSVKGDIAMSPEPINHLTINHQEGTSDGGLIEENKNPPSVNQLDPVEIWQMTAGQLQAQMTRPNYESWVKPLRPLGCQDGVYRLAAASAQARDWVDSRLKSTLHGLILPLYPELVQVVIEAPPLPPLPESPPARMPARAAPAPLGKIKWSPK